MKPKRFTTVRSFMVAAVALSLAAGLLLSGCATTRGGKNKETTGTPPAEEAQPSAPAGAATAAAVAETSAGGPPVRTEPVAAVRTSAVKPPVRAATVGTPEQAAVGSAARFSQALGRLVAGGLEGLDWNRVVSVVGGIVLMALIWGLAFWLARLPTRRRTARPRLAVPPIGQHAAMAVAQ